MNRTWGMRVRAISVVGLITTAPVWMKAMVVMVYMLSKSGWKYGMFSKWLRVMHRSGLGNTSCANAMRQAIEGLDRPHLAPFQHNLDSVQRGIISVQAAQCDTRGDLARIRKSPGAEGADGVAGRITTSDP